MTDPNDKLGGTGEPTSLSLIERVKANDQSAWSRLADLYRPLVDRWCAAAGLQNADVCDVSQEVFLAVARGIEKFHRDQTGDTFRGWLHRITQNKLGDHWRKTQGGKLIGGLELEAHLRQQTAAQDSGSQENSAAEEKRILYRRALELMSTSFAEGTWKAFWGVVIEEREPQTVAKELNLTVNAVYLAKARVLARLREEFADAIED